MRKFQIALKGMMLMMISAELLATDRMVAITIDDLPFVGTNYSESGNLKRSGDRFSKIVNALVEKQVPATGFIIGGSIAKGQWALLENFRQQGFSLGNHTYTHIDLNRVGADKYIADIDKADVTLQSVMTQPKYFRYPYLAEGKGVAKQKVQDYLVAHHYTIAPVTIDSKDYHYNEKLLKISWRNRPERLAGIKNAYLSYLETQITKADKMNHEGRPEILLIHANLINSHAMPEVIEMFEKHGYRFITLDEAISRQKAYHNEHHLIAKNEPHQEVH